MSFVCGMFVHRPDKSGPCGMKRCARSQTIQLTEPEFESDPPTRKKAVRITFTFVHSFRSSMTSVRFYERHRSARPRRSTTSESNSVSRLNRTGEQEPIDPERSTNLIQSNLPSIQFNQAWMDSACDSRAVLSGYLAV